MGTKRATNSEVNSKVGSSLSPSVKCPTRKEIVDTGKATVLELGSADNKLVSIDSVNIKVTPEFSIILSDSLASYTISQTGYQPIDGTHMMFMGGITAKLKAGQTLSGGTMDTFAFNKAVYVKSTSGSTTLIPASSVKRGGSYTVN